MVVYVLAHSILQNHRKNFEYFLDDFFLFLCSFFFSNFRIIQKLSKMPKVNFFVKIVLSHHAEKLP